MTVRLLPAKPIDLEGFPVARVLPRASMRAIGPFVFLDHMGPHTLAPRVGFDVRPHPHIGLATLTYLYEGAIVHRDSLGVVETIRPGEVNLMCAGAGVVHSERSTDEGRANGETIHGLQFWLALPASHEDAEPTFEHTAREALPDVDLGGVRGKLVVGRFADASSPVSFPTRALLLDLFVEATKTLTLESDEDEVAIYVVDGGLVVDGEPVVARTLARLDERRATIEATRGTRFVIFGGAKLDAPRKMEWNFVATDDARIERAKAAWRERRFPTIPTDDVEFVPLPDRPSTGG